MAESMTQRFLVFIFVCGVVLFACGLANTVAGFIWLDYADYEFFKFRGDGIWSGVGLLINGAFGVVVFCQRSKKATQRFVILSVLVFLSSSLQAWLSYITYNKVKEHLNSLPSCKAEDQINSSCRILNGQERIEAIFLTIRTSSIIGAAVCFLGFSVTSIVLHGQQSEPTAMAEDGNGD